MCQNFQAKAISGLPNTFSFHKLCGNIIQAKNKSIASILFSISSFHLSILACCLECLNCRGTNLSLFKF